MEKKYYIRIQGQLVEVNKVVYCAYYQMRRKEKTLYEKDERNRVTLYSNMDTDEIMGEEMIPDNHSETAEDIALAKTIHQQLHQCLDMLSESERNLILAIYFQGLSGRSYSKIMGIPQKTVDYRHRRILKKLKLFMNI